MIKLIMILKIKWVMVEKDSIQKIVNDVLESQYDPNNFLSHPILPKHLNQLYWRLSVVYKPHRSYYHQLFIDN